MSKTLDEVIDNLSLNRRARIEQRWRELIREEMTLQALRATDGEIRFWSPSDFRYDIAPFFNPPVRRFPMTNQAAEVAKRRTFAIISHPDLTL